MRPLIIDNFAGGGGASTGLEAAFGRPVDVAVNHDEAAIAVHAANHPTTRHLCQSIMSIDPLDATEGKPVLLVWFSPDCKHHSKAKGGKPREKNIRDLAWVVPHWIERLKKATPNGEGAPIMIALENVEEFRDWGPLDADGHPIKERKGEEFKLWVARIRRLGYKVEWRELRACDFGGVVLDAAPTTRKRLFLVARRDGRPIRWPVQTHGRPGSPEVLSGKLKPWRVAADCIDWSVACPSIFERKRPLEEATCRRIAAGVMRYVVNAARPFIVPVTNKGWNPDRTWSADEPLRTITTARGGEYAIAQPSIIPVTHSGGVRVHSIEEPFRTVTGANRGELAIAVPHLSTMRNAQKPFTAADEPMHTVTANGAHKSVVTAHLTHFYSSNTRGGEGDPAKPMKTVTAGGQHHGLVEATFVSPYYGEGAGGKVRGHSPAEPMPVVPCEPRHAAVAAFLAQHNTERAGRINAGQPADKPLSTITGRGTQQQVVHTTMVEAGALPPDLMDSAVRVAAFLVKYYGSEVGQYQAADEPLDTITAKPRFAVVTVTIDAVTFVLVDIGMRMLMPPELAAAQNFPEGYILDPECWYRTDRGNLKFGRLPKSHQIAKIGNSVCPNMAEVLARANLPEHCTGYVPAEEVAA